MDPSPDYDAAQLGNDRSDKASIARRGFLRVSAGLAATGVGIASLSGNVAAHFPSDLAIDIKPGSDQNSINPNSKGVIPVAVLQTDEFDPTSEDVRYRFGAPDVVGDGDGARPAHDGHVEDVDGDGRDDLVLHFPTDKTGFDGDESEGRLEWERTESGEHGLSGTDTVTIVGRGSR
ncbi:hypothetical protein [Haloplanus halobius]|uniref:hypothetical protein n=1 Tax=Haloplanus halobius TaxID=2934938 RepID=UPI00200E830E|nr:hypothetical protein [Haloplanus sp. XH21]